MSRTYRVAVIVGEDLVFEPSEAADAYRVWKRADPDSHTSGWLSAGGYDIAGAAAIPADDGGALPGLVVEAAEARVPWASVNALMGLSGTVAEALQIVEYADGAARLTYRFVLPLMGGDPLDRILAQDRELLDLMLEQRKGIAESQGVKKLELPDGRTEEYASIEVWDRRVMEVRARIAWLEQAQGGNVLPRMEVW